MNRASNLIIAGNKTDQIDVRLSYKIVRLFSEGLYASSNKAIEELVANSFDAGAQRVIVLLPADFHDQSATVVVFDDGEGMDAEGLKQHWLIGKSLKRILSTLPRGRSQIGKFGIGKLATYVLANNLTHVTKKDGKYYLTSMDYRKVDERGDEEMEPKSPIRIDLRELSEEQAKEALATWITTPVFQRCGIRLFGKSSSSSWTFAILSDLKEKVHEIRRGVLEWVLRTALPLRDDFAIFLDGVKLEPRKSGKGRLARWVIGKDIVELQKPAPDEIEISEDTNAPTASPKRFGLVHKDLGRITGYAEIYKTPLTQGKSEELGRSNGFFVYVFDRLINVQDGHFGIGPHELRHGTFSRIRVVVHMDGLDAFLQSDRERIREGPVLEDAQNILRAIFNFLRTEIQKHDAEEESGAKLAHKLASSPASLSRRPIIEMARAALEGKIASHYLLLPSALTTAEREHVLSNLEDRAETPEQFISGIDFVYDATTNDGIAIYDVSTGRLRINGLHPFVGAFFDEFANKTSGLPLEMFALAEVLLESHLYQAGLKQDNLDLVMAARDQLLRYFAQESGRRTALTVANALRNSKNDEDRLEIEVVEAFRSLGFEATRVGGKGKPDGVAKAPLSPDEKKNTRKYAVTLEAKSKKKDGAKLKTKSFGVSTIARQRDDYRCEHAIVVAPAFDHTPGKESALSKEIMADRANSEARHEPRTITAIHVEDLARLVQLRPIKRLGLAKIRELFITCSMPEQCKEWIDKIQSMVVSKPPYGKIINAIHRLQIESRNEPVGYGELRNELRHEAPAITYPNLDDLSDLCKAMSQMAPGAMMATERSVELDQSPANVLAAIEAATKEYLADIH